MQQNQNIKRQFTCYFCNKLIKNETELGHTTVCGNVLVPCPNKCGSYVPRMDLQKHKNECLNRITKSTSSRLQSTNNYENDHNLAVTSNTLDRKLFMKNVPIPDITEMFLKTQNDLKKFSNKLANFEQKSHDNNILYQQIDLCKNLQNQQKIDLEQIKYHNQILNEWKKSVELQIENFKQTLTVYNKSQNETDLHWMNLQQKLMILDQLQMDINLQSETFIKEQKFNRQLHLEFAQKLDEFKDYFTQENALIGSLWNDEQFEVNKIKTEIDGIKKIIDEQKAKYNNIIFDVKTVSQIASETAEKLELQEREFKEIKKQLNQIKLDFENLEEVALNKSYNFGICSHMPGHILWKIADFGNKMQLAKDSNNILKSPLFYTHEYGYKIKVLLFLNGLKKWKDRYALLSIHVMKGEYDELLKWPCHIEGSITLRDLENLELPKNFSKFISAKYQSAGEDSEEPQESSSSYIFIPHTTLMKSTHLKDDTIFLDIKIDQNKKLMSESLL